MDAGDDLLGVQDCERVMNMSDNLQKRIAEGLTRAKGKHIGKSPADYEGIMKLVAENSTQFNRFSETTEREVMEMAGVKPSCYAKCKRMLIAAMSEEVWPYTWAKPRRMANRPMYERVVKENRGSEYWQ